MKPYKSILLIALFVISTFAVIPVHAVSGAAYLGNASTLTAASAFTQALYNVSARAGTNIALYQDGVATSGTVYIAINLSGVTFTGSQFQLYLTTSGFANPINSSTDTLFSGLLSVANLVTLGTITSVTFNNAAYGLPYTGTNSPAFYYGTTTAGVAEVIFPVPYTIAGGFYYVKIFDGTTTPTIVTAQQVQILPNIAISPTATSSAPVGAGVPITVSGVAWGAGSTVNVSVLAPANAVGGMLEQSSSLQTASATGTFTWTFAMPDDNVLVPYYAGGSGTDNNTVWAFNPANASVQPMTPVNALLNVSTSAFYIGRAFYTIFSVDSGGNFVSSAGTPPAGGFGGLNNASLSAKVLGTVYVNGTNFYAYSAQFNPGSALTAQLVSSTGAVTALPLTMISALSAKGYFNASFTVPIVQLGTYTVEFKDLSTSWNFSLTVLTTLVITPSKGPIGTNVNVAGYGFTTGANVTVFWFGTQFILAGVPADTDNILLATFTNITAGTFSFNFTVPVAYGGSHTILGNDSSSVVGTGIFTITASWNLSASSGNLGSAFYVQGQGLAVGATTYLSTQFPAINGNATGAAQGLYGIFYDNVLANAGVVFLEGTGNGVANWTLTAAGVPMTHYVTVENYVNWPTSGGYTVEAVLPYAVNGTTLEQTALTTLLNTQSTSISSLSTAIAALQTTANSILTSSTANGASLTALSSSVASVQSSLTSLQSSVSSLSSAVSSLASSQSSAFSTLTSAVNSVGTSVTALGTSITGVNNAISSLTTTVGTINTNTSGLGAAVSKVDSDVAGVASSVSSLSSTLGTVNTNVSSIQSSVSGIKTETDTLSNMTNILYIAVILIAIAVVLQIVILVRKK